MATREAAVRATLDSSSYVAGLRNMGDATRNFAKLSKHELKESFGEGMKETKKVFGETGRELKGLLTTAVSIGGAFSFEEGIRGAVSMNGKFRMIADAISDSTGKLATWEDVQEDIESAATTSKQAIGGMADAFEMIRQKTDNAEFAKEALVNVGKFATSTKINLDLVGGAAAALEQKFGATAESVPKMLATILKAGRGAAGFAEIAPQIDRIGAIALEAGLKGERGFKFFMGVMNATHGPLRDTEAQLAGIDGVLGQLQKDIKLDAIAKQLSPANPKKFANEIKHAKDSLVALKMILGKKGGADVLKEAFGKQKETRETLKILLAPFEKAAGKGKTDEERKKGIAAFDRSLEALARSSESNADMSKRFEEESQSAEANMREAMNSLEKAFGNPKLLGAVTRLSEKLPELASHLADFVGWATDHPWQAAGAVVGGKVAMGVAPGLVGSIGVGLAKAGAKSLAGAGAAALGGEGLVGGLLAKVAGNAGGGAAAASIAKGLAALSGTAAAGAETAAAGTALAGGATAAVGAGGGATGLAALGAAAGPAAVAVASFLGAIGLVGAAAYGGAKVGGLDKLKKESESEGGIFNAIKSAWKGSAKATSGADYDRVMKAAGVTPAPAPVRASPATMILDEVTIKAAKSTQHHAKKTDEAAVALSSLAGSARTLDGYFRTLGAGKSSGGNHGPVGLAPVVPGSTPYPSSR